MMQVSSTSIVALAYTGMYKA